MCTIGYVVNPRASPALTAVVTCTHPSPTFTISQLPVVTQLPTSFAVANFQNTYHLDPPSPGLSALVLTTPSVNPLVALSSDPCHNKIHYDVSKDLNTVCVSKPYGFSTSITNEQRYSPVVEDTLHRNFRIEFDHPVLTSTIDFKGTLTVGDLLEELHSHFHAWVGSREMSKLEGDGTYCHAATIARTKRCEAAFDTRAEWGRGMKRVDILGKETKFRGIYLNTSCISDYLTLYVVFGK